MKHPFSLGVALFLGMVLVGCGSGSSTNASGPQSSSIALADHNTLTLKADTTRVPVGGAVNTQILFTNGTSNAITTVYYGYGSDILAYPAGGILVTNSAGAPIGTDGNVLPALPIAAPQPTTVTLQPGETLQLSQRYTFIKADTYTISGQVMPALGGVNPVPGTPEKTASFSVTVH